MIVRRPGSVGVVTPVGHPNATPRGPLRARTTRRAQAAPPRQRPPASYRMPAGTDDIPIPSYVAGARIIIDDSNPERWTPRVTVEKKYREG